MGREWEGSRAHAFNRQRDDARDAMKSHLNHDIAMYQRQIDEKISELQQEGNNLQTIGAMAKGAESLLTQGKKGLDAFDHQLVQIRRRM
ncbi:hypothetical protein E4665_16595 [Sporolactobacillus shoreae]|uniref:DUF5082 domain-containing protein n=1 Tax=Sporolactobacillus shoreae TaxID=1465501 RepID=A0A4Z0GIQ8_9BACL|nr:hypothetical protein [Sporolactobacillus shoreae]TGA96126.1 hypothetical protein E4665_16595 [Sporolactobacillus shoreae]